MNKKQRKLFYMTIIASIFIGLMIEFVNGIVQNPFGIGLIFYVLYMISFKLSLIYDFLTKKEEKEDDSRKKV